MAARLPLLVKMQGGMEGFRVIEERRENNLGNLPAIDDVACGAAEPGLVPVRIRSRAKVGAFLSDER